MSSSGGSSSDSYGRCHETGQSARKRAKIRSRVSKSWAQNERAEISVSGASMDGRAAVTVLMPARSQTRGAPAIA